jgi:cbb3-type cytochrome c oxidase subunit III
MTMSKRILLAAATSLAFMFAAFPSAGQPAAGGTPDLSARLKELEGNPRQLEAASKAGAKIASFCANCHGDGGNSVKPDVPNLAGQNVHYLMEQMHQFMDGRRKNSDFKKRLIKVLSPDEKVNLIAFYSTQEVARKPPADVALARKGKDLYAKNCAECHEDNGRGTQKYARVAGQQTGYLTAALKGYRDGSSARINRQMAVSIEGMTDAEITALVTYVSSMN